MNLHPDIATRPEAVQHIKDDIIQQFVEIQLDTADTQFLLELATSYLTDCYSELTLKEIEERIASLYDKELYEELLDNSQFTYNKNNIPERY